MAKDKKLVPIKYANRDFASIKRDLEEYARIYYPDTLKDFSQAGFGSLMLDTVAYIGDMLSFYLDYNVNESFMATALEYDNVLKHAEALGYKTPGANAAFGQVAMYVLIPSVGDGLGPDLNYMPIVRRGSVFSSDAGTSYVLLEDVDFANTNNEVVVARVDETTGLPTRYAVKAYGTIMSGQLDRVTLRVGDFERFLRIEVPLDNITEIVDVFDEEGHSYFQVDHLSQNIVYTAIPNTSSDKQDAPNILKARSVPRRFTVEREGGRTFMRFGYGSDSEITRNPIVHPSNLILKRDGRNYENLQNFDPSKILNTDKFGIAPTNTTLTVIVRRNFNDTVNAGIGVVNKVSNAIYRFSQDADSSIKKNIVKTSLEVINEEPIVGDVDIPDSFELKVRAKGHFASQNRAVTKQDYTSLVYNMPSRFGAIKRCNITHDNDSFKRNLNLYVVSQNSEGQLVKTNGTIKNNLKTWMTQYKMINDTIDILDGKVVNFGIDFVAVSDLGLNKYDVFNRIVRRMREFFETPYEMGEPIIITRLYDIINDTVGVVDVVSIKIKNINGGPYSNVVFNTDHHISPDGRYISTPEDCIMELKFPLKDIRGTVR